MDKGYKNGFDIVDGYPGVWRTVGGRRIFIRQGEPLDKAMQRSGKFRETDETKFRKIVKNDKPEVLRENYYVLKNHENEMENANWLKETFDTKVVLLSELNNQKNIDAKLNDKVYCEFKNISTDRSIENQIRKAKKQLLSADYEKNYKSLLLNVTSNRTMDDTCKQVIRQHYSHINCEVFYIVKIKEDYKILYLNKK